MSLKSVLCIAVFLVCIMYIETLPSFPVAISHFTKDEKRLQLMNCQLLLILAEEQFFVTNYKRLRKEETTFFGDLIQRNVELLNENIPNLLLFAFILIVSLLGC